MCDSTSKNHILAQFQFGLFESENFKSMSEWESASTQSAGEYLEDNLGEVLKEILLECANLRPRDPVAFVASAFGRSRFRIFLQ